MKITSKLLHDCFLAALITLLFMISIMCLVQAQLIDKPMIQYTESVNTQPVYKITADARSYQCFDNVSKFITCENVTYTQALDHFENIILSRKVLSITTAKGKTIPMPSIADEKTGIISIFKYPIGERNTVEYGRCRQYEIDKGVCEEMTQ
jgi:hypothetical protein